MSRVAIIPARGGSKRIPRKNVRPFGGQPMIAWSIAAARQTGIFSRIVVSTDDPEIADVARAAGAEVPFVRPDDLADDAMVCGNFGADFDERVFRDAEFNDLISTWKFLRCCRR